MELFKTLDCKGIVPDTPVYNSLISGFSLNSKWKEMQSLLNEMKSKNVHDVKTMNIVIDSYCKAGMVDEAQKLVKDMECRGPRPSLVTYNTLIDGFITRGQIEEARALFDSLNSKGFTPTVVTYNSIMSYYCKHKKMREAMSLFDKMSQEGVSPSLITYNILLYGLFKIKKLRKAVVFFNGMTEIDISTWRILLHGLCSLGLLDQAGWVLQAFPFPDVQGYNILIQGAAKSGRRDLTSELLVGMRQRGLKPDNRTLNILLRSYFVAGDTELAIQVFEDSEELRGPDSYHIFLEGLINSAHHAHLVPQVLQLMEDKNIALKLPIPPTATKLLGLDGSEK
uniref:pentatricopeptide repeat-containing protein At1g62670, mitochondrial-like n=1 Tax=Erigeron canadensis TaxID=72917 RepID=UPI001CB9A107|nr:pentatricopeptide repeat-containing protein At1g62670, mitochondrial-like [Erigeron canadensis]